MLTMFIIVFRLRDSLCWTIVSTHIYKAFMLPVETQLISYTGSHNITAYKSYH